VRLRSLLKSWILGRLERVKNRPRVIIIDPHKLLSQTDEGLKTFADKHGFIVIFASTNLVFRELYDHATKDPVKLKLLLIDQTPVSRRMVSSSPRAPPLFYPDLIRDVSEEEIINLDLQQFLKDKTGDPNWPKDANDRKYARSIVKHLKGVLEAHKNFRDTGRPGFNDQDFHTIIAFASLGLGDVAFKTLESGDYWKIVFAHEEFKELEDLAPESLKRIKKYLEKAPKPFNWCATQDPAVVINSIYLAVILSQHSDDWKSLLFQIDPDGRKFSEISVSDLNEAVSNLINGAPDKADQDLASLEESLSTDSLKTLLVEQLKIKEPAGFLRVLEREQYSILICSLALLMAIGDILSPDPATLVHKRVQEILFQDNAGDQKRYVDERSSAAWDNLTEAYRLATEVQALHQELTTSLRRIKAAPAEKTDIQFFWELWNTKRVNRLEYYLSRLERIVHYGDDILLHRTTDSLPAEFGAMLQSIKERIRDLTKKDADLLDEINVKFQNYVLKAYPKWVKGDPDVVLTAQFLSRCVKPHWDPVKEDALVLVFDGMRYDIWDEMLRPLFLKYMDEKQIYLGSSLLPSETQYSRKAIAAGIFPDSFSTNEAENKLLQQPLKDEFRITAMVEKVESDGLGTGETVRYHAGRLDMIIWDLCDEALHHIGVKEVGGYDIPATPLVLLYQQRLKSIFEREVMAVIRKLKPGTKVFVTADHGFGRVGRNRIWFKDEDVPEPTDCRYTFCMLRYKIGMTSLPPQLKQQVIEFTPADLRMPEKVEKIERQSRAKTVKKYGSIAFPRPGYAFGRDHERFDPPAFSHGGVSMQEMFVPMVVLQVKESAKDLIDMQFSSAPKEAVEGEELTFRLILHYTGKTGIEGQEIPVTVEASYSRDPDTFPLSSRTVYLPPWSQKEVNFRFTPAQEEALPDERKAGQLRRWFTATAIYKEGGRKVRRTLPAQEFVIQLNSERIVRRVGGLGNILGLTPKGDSNPVVLR